MRRLSQYWWLISIIISTIFYSCTLKQQIQIEKEPLTINKVAVKPAAFNPYKSPSAKDIPPQFKDKDGYWTGFACRARVLMS